MNARKHLEAAVKELQKTNKDNIYDGIIEVLKEIGNKWKQLEYSIITPKEFQWFSEKLRRAIDKKIFFYPKNLRIEGEIKYTLYPIINKINEDGTIDYIYRPFLRIHPVILKEILDIVEKNKLKPSHDEDELAIVLDYIIERKSLEHGKLIYLKVRVAYVYDEFYEEEGDIIEEREIDLDKLGEEFREIRFKNEDILYFKFKYDF